MDNHNRICATQNRIGLFGGSFNPIHRGHIAVAQDVLERYNFGHIYFIPSFAAPHKARKTMASPAHRVAMAEMALKDKPGMSISDIEIQRQGMSYTIETLQHFKSAESQANCYFFIIGMDAFLEIHTWKSYRKLFEEMAFVIMSRPQKACRLEDFQNSVAKYARRRISDRYRWDAAHCVLKHPRMKPLHVTRVTAVDVASTRIRTKIKRGEDVTREVGPVVADYIKTKGLYR